MGRILAIDYGQKRAGLAVTDDQQIIANALDTIHVSELMKYLKNYFLHHQVDGVVVGEPFTLDNHPSDASRYIEPFVKNFRRTFPAINLYRYDERFTSAMAFQTMIEAGLSKKKRADKGMVDRVSATILLQSWLESQRIAGERNTNSSL